MISEIMYLQNYTMLANILIFIGAGRRSSKASLFNSRSVEVMVLVLIMVCLTCLHTTLCTVSDDNVIVGSYRYIRERTLYFFDNT